MNKKLISFAAAAATLFAMSACNKGANQIDVVTPGTGTYAKVSISMGTPATRATVGNPDEFDAGSADEAQVKSIMLVVYDTDGKVVGYGSTSNETPAAGTGTENVSDKYEKVVELTMVGEKSAAAKVVAYVNVANEILPLNEASEETTTEIGKLGEFVMTNAAFFDTSDNDKWKVATDIVDGSLYSSPDAADAGKFTTRIYVERLAAKVTVNNETENSAEKLTATGISIHGYNNEKAYTLVFDAEHAVWAPTGTAPKMFKLKNQWPEEEFDDVDDDDDWTKGDYRNYWAKGFYYDTDYADFSSTLKYVSSNELRRTDATNGDIKRIAMGGAGYTTEHTYGLDVVKDDNYNALGAATSAIVLGQYKVEGADDAEELFNPDGEGYDFYLLFDKVGTESYTIFNEAQLIQYLLDADKLALTKDNKPIEDLTEYFELTWDSTAKKYSLTYKGEDGVLNNNGEAFDPETLTAATNARHYNLGYAYFFAPIEHLGGKGEVGQYGVVRNHSYQLGVKSINSLGAPLDDDHFGEDPNNPDPEDPGEEPIIPDPDETALIQVELNVLSWHVVSQEVNL